MNKTNKQIITSLQHRMITKSILTTLLKIAVMWVVMVLIYAIARGICMQRVWMDTDTGYWLLNFIDDNVVALLLFVSVVGIIIIIIQEWKKTFSYLYQVMDAIALIYEQTDQMVSLPPELNEVENQMNQLKLRIEKNEQMAREAEQRKNDLIVYLAHDLKTPLTSVIGYLSLLAEEKEISNETRDKYTSISLHKAERLEELINEFFEITRFNLTQLELMPTTVNLSRMMEQVVFEFQPMLSEKDLTCEADIEPDVQLCCDPDKMQRVLDNLLRNAVNYCYPNTAIVVKMKQEDTQVMLSVTNQGDDIPPAKIKRIFEQFFRADTSRSSASGGAGLGLAIAKEIVELHGGQINATSEKHQICFSVTLPMEI